MQKNTDQEVANGTNARLIAQSGKQENERFQPKCKRTRCTASSAKCAKKAQKMAKEMDIQQLKFAGGHPPNYYAAGKLLKYARADGMACSQLPVVVCDRTCLLNGMYATSSLR